MYRENENDVFEQCDALKRENDAFKKKLAILSTFALLACMAYSASTLQLHLRAQSPLWHFSAFARFAFVSGAAWYLWARSEFIFQGMKTPPAAAWQSAARIVLMTLGITNALGALSGLYGIFAALS